MTSRAFIALTLTLLAGLAGSAAAKTSLHAHGRAEQVYVTGLAKNAQVSLLNGSGHSVATKHADSLGGVLFRKVSPGKNYKVRSGAQTSKPVTVHSDASAPWDPS